MKNVREKTKEGWELFSQNGTVGAYLLYCAVRRGERERGDG